MSGARSALEKGPKGRLLVGPQPAEQRCPEGPGCLQSRAFQHLDFSRASQRALVKCSPRARGKQEGLLPVGMDTVLPRVRACSCHHSFGPRSRHGGCALLIQAPVPIPTHALLFCPQEYLSPVPTLISPPLSTQLWGEKLTLTVDIYEIGCYHA